MIKKAFLRLDDKVQRSIMHTGMQLYVTYPFEEVTVRMLTEKLNINSATFYRYFDEKEDLALLIYRDIVSKFSDTSVNIFKMKLDRSELSAEEQEFLIAMKKWPDYMMHKVVFEVELEFTLPMIKASLQKERILGNLRNNVVEDFVAYMYATAEYNFVCYCRQNNITDPEMIEGLSNYMDQSLFMDGIMLQECEKVKKEAAGGNPA